jgi:hypothetical protein
MRAKTSCWSTQVPCDNIYSRPEWLKHDTKLHSQCTKQTFLSKCFNKIFSNKLAERKIFYQVWHAISSREVSRMVKVFSRHNDVNLGIQMCGKNNRQKKLVLLFRPSNEKKLLCLLLSVSNLLAVAHGP